jgi:hypothetical protein
MGIVRRIHEPQPRLPMPQVVTTCGLVLSVGLGDKAESPTNIKVLSSLAVGTIGWAFCEPLTIDLLLAVGRVGKRVEGIWPRRNMDTWRNAGGADCVPPATNSLLRVSAAAARVMAPFAHWTATASGIGQYSFVATRNA